MSILGLKKLFTKYKTHILAWAIFIIYDVFITGLIIGQFGDTFFYIVSYLCNITLFYTYAFLLKKVLNTTPAWKKFIAVTLLIFSQILLYIFALFLTEKICIYLTLMPSNHEFSLNKGFFLSAGWRALYFIGFATGYVFILKSFVEGKRAEKLEKQSLIDQIEKQNLENDLIQSQNNFLRSQINPHFLFNTLNFIYNDTRKKAPIAADAIMNLAEMMRYALKRPDANDLVPLSEEVEQMEHLINVHKLRTAGTTNLDLIVKNDIFGVKFPPLILLTLVENMFKHGNLSHSVHPAEIIIEIENNVLSITTINMINNTEAKESTKIGMENIHKRLSNFYKEGYTFTYEKDLINRYITSIKINL